MVSTTDKGQEIKGEVEAIGVTFDSFLRSELEEIQNECLNAAQQKFKELTTKKGLYGFFTCF